MFEFFLFWFPCFLISGAWEVIKIRELIQQDIANKKMHEENGHPEWYNPQVRQSNIFFSFVACATPVYNISQAAMAAVELIYAFGKFIEAKLSKPLISPKNSKE